LINGIDKKEAMEKTEELFHILGIGDKVNMFPSQLSGGEQQRVAVARGIIHNPRLIVCDEPTSYLDYATGIKVMDLFHKIVLSRNMTIILVTHDNRILKFADHIVKIDDGKIYSDGL
jgi:putative ABC transport system ATP-binding protein